MGFSLKYALAGAARRGSEIIQETREDAFSFMDQQLNSWNDSAKEEKDKHEKKTLRMKNNMKFLSTRGFSDDQIGAALFEEDGGDAIIKHIQELEKAGQPVPVADIISFAPDRKESGITASEWFANAAGKIKEGKSIEEITGGGLTGMFAQSRLKSFEALTGQDPSQMRAYARGEYEYGERPSGATVKLVDPYKKAQVDKALRPEGAFTASELNRFEDAAGQKIGVTLGFDRITGARTFPEDKANLADIAMQAAALAQEEYYRLQTAEGGGLTEAQAYTKARIFAQSKADELQKAAVAAKKQDDTTDTSIIDFTGMSIQEISDATRSQIQGLDPNNADDIKKINTLLGQAMSALVAAGEASNIAKPYEEAAREIELIRKSIMN